MLVYSTVQQAEEAIAAIAHLAKEVNESLIGHLEEAHFQKGLEIVIQDSLSLRVEAERILPVSIRGTCLRDVRDELDLVIHVPVDEVEGLPSAKHVLVVCELKVHANVSEVIPQVLRYVSSLSRCTADHAPVYHRALIINFRPGFTFTPAMIHELMMLDRRRESEEIPTALFEQMRQELIAPEMLSPHLLATPEVVAVSAANLPAALFHNGP